MNIRSNRHIIYLTLFCIIFILINLFTLYNGHNWGGDFSQYIIHARNIIEGRPYSSDIMLEKSVIYPPGFPILIVPIVKFFGINFIALKTINVFFWYGFIFLFYLIASRSINKKMTALFCVFFATSSEFFYFKQNVLSDIPFLFFLYLSIYLFLKYYESDSKNRIILLIMAALSMGFSFLIRTAGIMIFISAIYYIIVTKKRWKDVLFLSIVFIIFYFIQNLFTGSNVGFLNVITDNPRQYLYLLLKHSALSVKSIFWFFLPGQSIFTASIFFLLDKIAIYVSPLLYLFIFFIFIKRSIQHKISFEGCFFFFYLVMLLFWSGFMNTTTAFVRYVYPILGFILIFVSEYAQYFKKYSGLILKTLIVCIILLNILNIFVIFNFNDDVIYKKDNIEMFSWVKNNIKENEHYMIWKPRVSSLMTGRIGTAPWIITPKYAVETFVERIKKFNISYIILFRDTDKFLISVCEHNSSILMPVWQNKEYKVFKIVKSKF